MDFLAADTGFKRAETDKLDLALFDFCKLVHATLTGSFKKEDMDPIEERDPDFIKKYPDYTLSKILGRGQAGIVFLGEDEKENPLFAIKVIHLPSAVGVGLPLRKTFLVYQNVLKELSHPNIMNYLGWTVVDNEAHVYTKFCNQGSLSKLIGENGIEDICVIKNIVRQILDGLIYLHIHGIVHRDLKPGNVLLHDGVVIITDLGSARLQQPCCDDPKKLSGTAFYCPPEGIKNDFVYEHHAEDIWALGCCLYEMVMGKPPWFEHDNVFSIYFELSRLGDNVDNPLISTVINSGRLDSTGIDFLEACLKVNPKERPTSLKLAEMDFIKNSH